jgi:hypothetical protein
MKETTEQYCIDKGVIDAIHRHDAKGSYEVTTQGYITTTGNMWKGPIEEFNLIVDKADTFEGMEPSDLVAFCPLDAKKISDTQFKWTAKNYEPTRDIDVVYYRFYDIPYGE